MKIIQVVTLISPDGAFGGPVRVAFNQCRQLSELGHDVMVMGPRRGFDTPPSEIDGTPVSLTKALTLVPFTGFSGIASPGLLWQLFRRRRAFDVLHVHMGRDLVTLPAALLALILGKRVVVQTHGMIIESRNPIAPVIDWMLTRPVLRRVHTALYLLEEEQRSLRRIEPAVSLQHLPNGVPIYETTADCRRTHPVEVLYLARLHPRKRPQLFVRAAAQLLQEGLDVTFRMVGPDGGEADDVSEAIAAIAQPDRLRWEGALPPERTIERMERASFYVLPSVNEPFPMAVLEALGVGLPVVITDTCGLADIVRSSGSGIVVNDSEDAFIAAVRTLSIDSELRAEMGAAARRAAVMHFGMDAVTRKLVSVYESEPTVSAGGRRVQS